MQGSCVDLLYTLSVIFFLVVAMEVGRLGYHTQGCMQIQPSWMVARFILHSHMNNAVEDARHCRTPSHRFRQHYDILRKQ